VNIPRDEVVPWLHKDQDEDVQTVEVIDVADLILDEVLDGGVTSGADPSVWDPIHIDREDRREEQDGVVDTDMEGEHHDQGVTSGNDEIVGDVKSSERKNKDKDKH
jgi:hypothetical protein